MSSSRIIPFIQNEYYHVFNRGVAKMPIFNNFYDYNRFLKTFLYYLINDIKPKFSTFTPTTVKLNTKKKIANIVCYCLMPNHFHLLLQQLKEAGITELLSKLSNSYTKYFNVKYKRVGPLFQGEFKAVRIEKDEQLIHVSRYIHLNPLVGYITKDLNSYLFSSYSEYTGNDKSLMCQKDIVLNQFKNLKDYEKFVLDQRDYGEKLEIIKHQLLDFEDC